jgi:hypothetical protein
MENKQTAVEWLEDEFSKFNDEIVNNREITFNEFHQRRIKLWEQAKAMEKEQMIEIYRLKAIIEFYEQGCGKEGCKATEPHVH